MLVRDDGLLSAAELERRFGEEMTRLSATRQEPALLQLQPAEAFVLIGTLQLACRSALLPDEARALAQTLAGQLAMLFPQTARLPR